MIKDFIGLGFLVLLVFFVSRGDHGSGGAVVLLMAVVTPEAGK